MKKVIKKAIDIETKINLQLFLETRIINFRYLKDHKSANKNKANRDNQDNNWDRDSYY